MTRLISEVAIQYLSALVILKLFSYWIIFNIKYIYMKPLQIRN